MGWTRQQAIDFGIEASEVERYVVMPGQACSYMIGQLKIIELRERARDRLGDQFSLREYHNQVLAVGIVPLQFWSRESISTSKKNSVRSSRPARSGALGKST
jgi:uncharacterized protein (DUF885 family)